MSVFEVVIFGRPQPAGSKRAFRNPHTGRVAVVDASKGTKPWQQQVAGAALEACGGVPMLLAGPLILDVKFLLRRPQGHYRTGRNAHLLRDTRTGLSHHEARHHEAPSRRRGRAHWRRLAR